MANDNQLRKDRKGGSFQKFLKLWMYLTSIFTFPFVFFFGLIRIWILLLITAFISILLVLFMPLLNKKTVARELPQVQEWKQKEDILSLIKYLNTHLPSMFNPAWDEATDALIEMGPKALPMLIEALDAETPYVSPDSNKKLPNELSLHTLRVNVVYCIGEIKDSSAIPSMKNALIKYKKDKGVVQEIKDALVKLGVSKEEIKQIAR